MWWIDCLSELKSRWVSCNASVPMCVVFNVKPIKGFLLFHNIFEHLEFYDDTSDFRFKIPWTLWHLRRLLMKSDALKRFLNVIHKHVETQWTSVQTRTWPCAALHCFGVWRLRGRSGLGPLVGAHAVAVLAESRAALAGFLIGQVQRRALLNGPVARVDGGVDFKVGLSLVLLQLSVVGVCDAAFVQTLVVLAHPRDLQLVGDVIALDLDCLWREPKTNPQTDKAFICLCLCFRGLS